MNRWAPESLKTPGSKEKHRNQTISVRFQLVHLGECFLLPPVKIFGQFAGVQELTPFINDRLSLAHFPGVHWFHNKSKLGSCWPQTNIALPSRGLNMFFNCEVCFRFWGAGDNIWKKKRRKPPAFKYQILRLVANPHCVSYVTCCWFTQQIHSQTSTFRAIPHHSSSISRNPRRPRWRGRPRGMPLTSFSSRSSQPFGRNWDAKHKKKLQPTPYSCILSTVIGVRGPLRPLSTTAILIGFVAEGSFSTEQRSLKSRELPLNWPLKKALFNHWDWLKDHCWSEQHLFYHKNQYES